ncbi:MAG: ACP S-malonyltransferase [bacterium]
MTKTAFIFPGQGAQYIGMGREFVENFAKSKEVFEEASDSLGYDMQKVVMEGSENDLMQTEVTQPAILTVSIAILEALTEKGFDCDFTAGLSLGEYSALVKAGFFDFKDAVSVVRERGKFMQSAVAFGHGAMAAVIGMPVERLLELLKEVAGVVELANFNSREQFVISGETSAVEAAVKKALENGAMKAVMLPVSAPFHSSLLSPAAEKLHEVLENTKTGLLQKKVVANVDAKVVQSEKEVIPNLVKQVNHAVLWAPSVELMINEGVDVFVEIGPGRALSGFVKRIAKAMNATVSIYNIEDIVTLKKFFESKR